MDNRISNYLIKNNMPRHNQIDFVNISVQKDTHLFIDPVLIDTGNTEFCKEAKIITNGYFNALYETYYNYGSDTRKRYLLKYAQEINSTHIGYAKRNGQGNTESGLFNVFKGIDNYINSIRLKRTFDIVLYVPNFAEDGMSDLLTNILYKKLSEFTLEQCKKYGFPTSPCIDNRFFWNPLTQNWEKYTGESMIINGKTILLVPKEIVQYRYRFTCDNYLRSVIVENICEDRAIISKDGKKLRPKKDDIRSQLINENGTIFLAIKNLTQNKTHFLDQYHKLVDEKYKSLQMSDEELDKIVYGTNFDDQQ